MLFVLFGLALGPINRGGGIQLAQDSAWMQTSHTIGIMLFQYSTDNGKYPEGKSSTEVFQKLIDEKYCSDPAIFYIPLPGKTKAQPGEKLKPENVCWDVTCCLNANDSDFLPVAFMTGYKITYTPGSPAIPLVKPFPRFGWEVPRNETWIGWLMGRPTIHWSDSGGLAVTYKSNAAMFLKSNKSADGGDFVPNFISPDFKPGDKSYRQLTPDGPLP